MQARRQRRNWIGDEYISRGGAMKTKPMTMLLAMLAGWINQQQQEVKN